MFRRVLVVLDHDPAAERIMPWVRRVVAPMRAEVRLFDVVPAGRAVAAGDRTVAYADQCEDAERRAADFRLAALAVRLREDGLVTSVETRVGDRVGAVLAAARAWGADAIALAAPLPRRWRRWLGRGVAADIVRRSPVPVLLARRSAQRVA